MQRHSGEFKKNRGSARRRHIGGMGAQGSHRASSLKVVNNREGSGSKSHKPAYLFTGHARRKRRHSPHEDF